jgi:hypothetical protein
MTNGTEGNRAILIAERIPAVSQPGGRRYFFCPIELGKGVLEDAKGEINKVFGKAVEKCT